MIVLRKKLAVSLTTLLLALSAFCSVETSIAAQPPGITTAPYTVSYSGKLTSSSGTAITTPQEIRFSLWKNNTYNSTTDVLADGSINATSANYAGWIEKHTVTPDSNGLFHVQLGSITTLPNFTSATHLFLQVEVKPQAAAMTSFELLDPDGVLSNGNDRFSMNSAPYSINSDTVDNADVGNNPGNIPQLDSNGNLNVTTIPQGTAYNLFILDALDTVTPSGTDTIKLQFGKTLNKVLAYDPVAKWFTFNDNVNIQGNLTTTGTINGVVINSSTVGPTNQVIGLEPNYPGAVLERSGTDNLGKLESFNAGANYYKWTTRQTTTQNIDLVVKYTLPQGFVSWGSNPISLQYKTQTNNPAENVVNITMLDTSGTPVTLAGSSALNSDTWNTSLITFLGTPTFTPGQEVQFRINLSASNTGSAQVGKITLNYISK